MKRSVLLFVIVVLLAAPVAFSQIDEEVNVGVIEVWTKVTTSDNRVINDLHPEDFSIYIDGKKMDLQCFDRTFDEPAAVSAEEPDQEPAFSEASTDRQKRAFIFFFDLRPHFKLLLPF